MPTDPTRRDDAVAAALSKLSHLAMLPDVAVRVLQLAENPNVTMSQMADVISTAPELCARILRIVNSAFYGFPGEVRSIERATTLMGLESVKNVTIAASLTRTFQGRPLSSTFSPRDLWTHSLAVAAATRLVALQVRPDTAEEAFLAGLLHDIGLMVALQYDRQKLAAVLAQMESDPSANVLRAEEAAFGATHEDFGAALLLMWKLPDTLVSVAGSHHEPFELPSVERTLPVMVYVADRLVAAVAPFQLDGALTEISEKALHHLRLTHDQASEILAALPAATEELQTVLVDAS